MSPEDHSEQSEESWLVSDERAKDPAANLARAEEWIAKRPDQPDGLMSKGVALLRLGQHSQAIEALRESLSLAERVLEEPRDDALKALIAHNLASALSAVGDEEQARRLYLRAIAWGSRAGTPDGKGFAALAACDLAMSLLKRGETGPAIDHLVEAIDLCQAGVSFEGCFAGARASFNLANIRLREGSIAEYERLMRLAFELGTVTNDTRGRRTAVGAGLSLGIWLSIAGRRSEAREMLAEAVSAGGEESASQESVAAAAFHLAEVLRDSGDLVGADSALQRSVDAAIASGEPGALQTGARGAAERGRIAEVLGSLGPSLPHYDQAMDLGQRRYPRGPQCRGPRGL